MRSSMRWWKLAIPQADDRNVSLGFLETKLKYADILRLDHQYGKASKHYSQGANGLAKKLGVDHPRTLDCFCEYTGMLVESRFIANLR